QQPPRHGGRVAEQRSLARAMADHLLRIDLDANDLERIVDAPADELRMQARADAEHHIGLGPQLMAGREWQAQLVAAVDHALPHTSRGHSIAAGRGRPETICRNASSVTAAASCGARMRADHLVRRCMMPSWSGISCR